MIDITATKDNSFTYFETNGGYIMTTKKNTQNEMKLELGKPEKIKTGLDPHLQKVILKSREGKAIDPIVSQSSEDGTVVVDVIAKLKDRKSLYRV